MPSHLSKTYRMCSNSDVSCALTSVDNNIGGVGSWMVMEELCGRDAGSGGGYTGGMEKLRTLCAFWSISHNTKSALKIFYSLKRKRRNWCAPLTCKQLRNPYGRQRA